MTPDDTIWQPIEQAVAEARRRLEEMGAQMAADPDGELDGTGRMLRLKRGCRR